MKEQLSHMPSLNDCIMKTVDAVYATLPQPPPSSSTLKKAKLVAHRGIHEPEDVTENTWKAFDLALEHRIWGIEFDVRWTQDEVPVILHDPDPSRVFPKASAGFKTKISRMTFQQLQSDYTEIPYLEEMLRRYGQSLHLFIEIKEPLDTLAKKSKMKELLQKLEPVRDFHIMSLRTELFRDFEFLPASCFLPVAEWNIHKLSDLAYRHHWAGLTSHYLLLGQKLLNKHVHQRQSCGTGFINSKNLLYRELNRGVEWIFTDKALTVKSLLEKALNS